MIQRNEKVRARRILIVDDSKDVLETMEQLLALLGHEVSGALSGETALKIAEAFQPEVILVDISMPGMNGYELARLLRGEKKWRGVKLAALTGYDIPTDPGNEEGEIFDAYFVKPVDIEGLTAFLAGP